MGKIRANGHFGMFVSCMKSNTLKGNTSVRKSLN
jgi:hypothetical protein